MILCRYGVCTSTVGRIYNTIRVNIHIIYFHWVHFWAVVRCRDKMEAFKAWIFSRKSHRGAPQKYTYKQEFMIWCQAVRRMGISEKNDMVLEIFSSGNSGCGEQKFLLVWKIFSSMSAESPRYSITDQTIISAI
jgi:hypothetical protein